MYGAAGAHSDRVEKAFVVVAPAKSGDGNRDRPISRKYNVKEAAEQFAAMARADGYPEAYVRTLYTTKPAPVAAA